MRFNDLITHLDASPGIYMMMCKSEPIYIGKAKDLKKRLKQYFVGKAPSHRISVMLSLVDDLKVIVTESEASALVLENKLIKEHQPKYNILLKDDKSFPYLAFSKHDFPRLVMKRTKVRRGDDLFGPYTNQKQARIVLDQIQRVFHLRNCSDHFFRNRTRPCIQYEIGRCSAPCVNKIMKHEYSQDVKEAKRLLKGESKDLTKHITTRMYEYAETEDFERAAACRDLIRSFATISQETKGSENMHVFDVKPMGHQMLVIKLEILDGQVVNTVFDYVGVEGKHIEEDWLLGYVYHHYQLFPLVKKVVLPIRQKDVLKEALGQHVVINSIEERGYQVWAKLTQENLNAYIQSKSDDLYQWPMFWQMVEQYFDRKISRVLCIDVSHHQGSSTYVSVVYCAETGMEKSLYRTYKVDCGGDDYEAIKQGLKKKLARGDLDQDTLWIIDGGVGQINAAHSVLEDNFGIITSASKGPKREWGKEKYYRFKESLELFQWPADMMKYILHIRDEAHNTAINMHRKALRKQSLRSVLDNVQGIGKQKKQAIMEFFGGLEALRCAKLIDIEKVPGIGQDLAKRIYQTLHVDS